MKNPFKFFFVVLLLSSAVVTNAQQKPAPTLKPPVLNSFWGTTKGGNLPLEFVLGVLDSSVWVIDDKKIRYNISHFIVVYRSKDKYEDEKTGELKTRINPISTTIRNEAYLPEVWQKSLYEQIKKEDELLITDIIVRDKKGNFFTAPEIRIRIQ